MFNWIVIFFSEYVHYFVVLVFSAIFLKSFLDKRKKGVLSTVILSSIVALILDKILNQIILSPRPFVSENIVPLFSHFADNGFPSEHTLLVTVLAGLVYIHNKKIGFVLMLLAIAVGVARVVAGVHHMIDILGALIIGLFAVLIGRWLVIRYSVVSL